MNRHARTVISALLALTLTGCADSKGGPTWNLSASGSFTLDDEAPVDLAIDDVFFGGFSAPVSACQPMVASWSLSGEREGERIAMDVWTALLPDAPPGVYEASPEPSAPDVALFHDPDSGEILGSFAFEFMEGPAALLGDEWTLVGGEMEITAALYDPEMAIDVEVDLDFSNGERGLRIEARLRQDERGEAFPHPLPECE